MLKVSCLIRGVGLYHAERHSFGNDRLCPNDSVLPNVKVSSSVHMILLYVRDGILSKINVV